MTERTCSVQKIVKGKIEFLRNAPNEATARAALANLRRGVGKHPGAVPEVWEYTLANVELPEQPYRRNGEPAEPTTEEWAIHGALTLFALHQQSKDIRTDCMNAENIGLGSAIRRLVKNNDDRERVKRRFDRIITADSIEELLNHLRSMIQMLRADGIALDYAKLANDLRWFQHPDYRDRIRLQWGRDFYYIAANDADEANSENSDQDQDEE